jgi:putative spermidine/putrescine transport system substrate-binding protein
MSRNNNRGLPLAIAALLLGSTGLLSACGGDATATPPAAATATTGAAAQATTGTTASGTTASGTTTSGSGSNMDALVAAAKQEGQLTVIALPHDWCDYADVINGFKAKYGLTVNELNPDAGSGDEVEAIKANKDNKGPQAPDVVDVGLSFGPQAKTDQLLQPYKVSTWSTIPDSAKDADGYWYGDYYGVMSLEVNTDTVKDPPKQWSDLTKPEYKGQVALAGDPRVSSQAINGVTAVALGTGGTMDNVQPGLDAFATMNKNGNFVPVIAKQGTIASGETPIVLRWDYNALADKDSLKGNPPIQVTVPDNGVLAGVYVQGISAYAPHPNAAKLWEEYLYSDEGQLLWLKGYCHPIRYNDLAGRNAIPSDLAAKLPPAAVYAKAIFPTLDQLTKANQTITKNWDSVVGANVK